METTQQIGARAKDFLSSWMNAQETRTRNTSNSSHTDIEKRTKPSVERFKCNGYASFSTSLNKVGFRVCIQDAKGNYVIGRTACFTPLLDVEMGKAIGLLHAMQWVKFFNLVNMDFETDSKVVANSIVSKRGWYL